MNPGFDSETLNILSDPVLVQGIEEAEAEITRGEIYTLDEVTETMRHNGRLPPDC